MLFFRSLFCLYSTTTLIFPLRFSKKITLNSHVLVKLHLVEHSGKQNHRSKYVITIYKLT